MREPIVRTSSLVAVVLVLMVAATGALAAAGCGGSGGTTGTSSSPSATASRGAPSPLPSALTETYSNDAFGFAFRYPSGFTVREQPDFLTGEGTVFDLALLPTAETAEAYGIEGGDGVRLAVWVYEMDDTWRGLDSSAMVEQVSVTIEDYLSTLSGIDATAVEPTEIDGFSGAQVAYSYDKIGRRDDFWTLFLVPGDGDYRLEIQASSPVDEADLLEPVWTEVINSFTTL